MAFSNKESWEKVDKEWRLGVESIYGQFLSVLGQNGVSLIKEIKVFCFCLNDWIIFSHFFS